MTKGQRSNLQALDDGLKQLGIRDIVDTTTCQWGEGGQTSKVELTGAAILKTVLGAVDRRLDAVKLGKSH